MVEEIIPEDPNKGDGLWQAIGKDKNGKDVIVGTYILNGLLKEIISGKCTRNEIRVLLFIARMTLGYQRDQTGYYGLKEFSEMTGIHRSHLSDAISGLKKKKMIFRRAKRGNVHMYSINLFRYGFPMTHYRICNGRNGMSKGEYVWGNASYLFGNSEESKNYIIVYGKKSYKKEQKLYIKTDIQSDIQTDNGAKSSTLGSRVLSPTSQSSAQKNSKDAKKLIRECIETINLLWSKRAVQENVNKIGKTIANYMKELKKIGEDPEWILKAVYCELALMPNGGINMFFLKVVERFGFKEEDKVFSKYKAFMNNS